MDEIKIVNLGRNDYYGWIYDIFSCTKTIPSEFSNRRLTQKEMWKLLRLLQPIDRYCADYDYKTPFEKLEYSKF